MEWRGRGRAALFFITTAILVAAACQPDEMSTALGCNEGVACAAGARCDFATNRCVSAVCVRADDCCYVADWDVTQCSDITTKSDTECAAYLKAARDNGFCLEDPGSTTYPGLCNTTGSCHGEFLNRSAYGQSTCCGPGLTCQNNQCATCLPQGSACNPDKKFEFECCLGLTCKFGVDQCVPAGGDGADCLFDDECARGLTCIGSTCHPLRKAGEACDDADNCEGYPYVNCTDGSCAPYSGGGGTGGTGTGTGTGTDTTQVCDPKYCSGCMSSCSDGYCFSCCYSCSGNACNSVCTG